MVKVQVNSGKTITHVWVRFNLPGKGKDDSQVSLDTERAMNQNHGHMYNDHHLINKPQSDIIRDDNDPGAGHRQHVEKGQCEENSCKEELNALFDKGRRNSCKHFDALFDKEETENHCLQENTLSDNEEESFISEDDIGGLPCNESSMLSSLSLEDHNNCIQYDDEAIPPPEPTDGFKGIKSSDESPSFPSGRKLIVLIYVLAILTCLFDTANAPSVSKATDYSLKPSAGFILQDYDFPEPRHPPKVRINAQEIWEAFKRPAKVSAIEFPPKKLPQIEWSGREVVVDFVLVSHDFHEPRFPPRVSRVDHGDIDKAFQSRAAASNYLGPFHIAVWTNDTKLQFSSAFACPVLNLTLLPVEHNGLLTVGLTIIKMQLLVDSQCFTLETEELPLSNIVSLGSIMATLGDKLTSLKRFNVSLKLKRRKRREENDEDNGKNSGRRNKQLTLARNVDSACFVNTIVVKSILVLGMVQPTSASLLDHIPPEHNVLLLIAVISLVAVVVYVVWSQSTDSTQSPSISAERTSHTQSPSISAERTSHTQSPSISAERTSHTQSPSISTHRTSHTQSPSISAERTSHTRVSSQDHQMHITTIKSLQEYQPTVEDVTSNQEDDQLSFEYSDEETSECPENVELPQDQLDGTRTEDHPDTMNLEPDLITSQSPAPRHESLADQHELCSEPSLEPAQSSEHHLPANDASQESEDLSVSTDQNILKADQVTSTSVCGDTPDVFVTSTIKEESVPQTELSTESVRAHDTSADQGIDSQPSEFPSIPTANHLDSIPSSPVEEQNPLQQTASPDSSCYDKYSIVIDYEHSDGFNTPARLSRPVTGDIVTVPVKDQILSEILVNPPTAKPDHRDNVRDFPCVSMPTVITGISSSKSSTSSVDPKKQTSESNQAPLISQPPVKVSDHDPSEGDHHQTDITETTPPSIDESSVDFFDSHVNSHELINIPKDGPFFIPHESRPSATMSQYQPHADSNTAARSHSPVSQDCCGVGERAEGEKQPTINVPMSDAQASKVQSDWKHKKDQSDKIAESTSTSDIPNIDNGCGPNVSAPGESSHQSQDPLYAEFISTSGSYKHSDNCSGPDFTSEHGHKVQPLPLVSAETPPLVSAETQNSGGNIPNNDVATVVNTTCNMSGPSHPHTNHHHFDPRPQIIDPSDHKLHEATSFIKTSDNDSKLPTKRKASGIISAGLKLSQPSADSPHTNHHRFDPRPQIIDPGDHTLPEATNYPEISDNNSKLPTKEKASGWVSVESELSQPPANSSFHMPPNQTSSHTNYQAVSSFPASGTPPPEVHTTGTEWTTPRLVGTEQCTDHEDMLTRQEKGQTSEAVAPQISGLPPPPLIKHKTSAAHYSENQSPVSGQDCGPCDTNNSIPITQLFGTHNSQNSIGILGPSSGGDSTHSSNSVHTFANSVTIETIDFGPLSTLVVCEESSGLSGAWPTLAEEDSELSILPGSTEHAQCIKNGSSDESTVIVVGHDIGDGTHVFNTLTECTPPIVLDQSEPDDGSDPRGNAVTDDDGRDLSGTDITAPYDENTAFVYLRPRYPRWYWGAPH